MRDGAGGEGLDVDVGAGAGVVFFVPAGEGGEEEEGDEGEDDGDDAVGWVSHDGVRCDHGEYLQEVREYHAILERLRHPDEVQRIFVDADLFGQQRDVVGAEETPAVWSHADAEVSHSDFQLCAAHEIGYCCCDAGVDLRGVVDGCVHLVVEGYDEDAGDQR